MSKSQPKWKFWGFCCYWGFFPPCKVSYEGFSPLNIDETKQNGNEFIRPTSLKSKLKSIQIDWELCKKFLLSLNLEAFNQGPSAKMKATENGVPWLWSMMPASMAGINALAEKFAHYVQSQTFCHTRWTDGWTTASWPDEHDWLHEQLLWVSE